MLAADQVSAERGEVATAGEATAEEAQAVAMAVEEMAGEEMAVAGPEAKEQMGMGARPAGLE